MKKIALVFAVSVIVPSLVLAWLAVRSLKDQQFLIERQESLLCQGISDGLARRVQDTLAEQQRVFGSKVAGLLRDREPVETALGFDDSIRRHWVLAEVGFVVSLAGEILSPEPTRPEAKRFLGSNRLFLANEESAEVYLNDRQLLEYNAGLAQQARMPSQQSAGGKADRQTALSKNNLRSVMPQQQVMLPPMKQEKEAQPPISKLAPSPAEFRLLVGDQSEGAVSRFVDNKLSVWLWCRPPQTPGCVFGVQLSLAGLEQLLSPIFRDAQPSLHQDFCLALLDDTGKPVTVSHPAFRANWRRPFVATEIGEVLPHWEAAVYLLNPARLDQAARNITLTLGLLVVVLVLAIGVGSWLIVADLNRQLTVARQKTDFVSNVSHELKTPLTSIRMFSELLAEGRVSDPAKQRSYLSIVTAETARLTRLINNVLDFARIDRGEKKYSMQSCDLVAVTAQTAESYRPNLEANGFRFTCELPEHPVVVTGDRDALAQLLVNLLSNAEKYSNSEKEVTLRLRLGSAPLPYVELQVLDRGLGVPSGSEEKIFEKFYRAHDSLSSGIQGCGLGLTLARQIARAHGGEIVYQARQGGGSIFSLRLPLKHSAATPA